MFRAKRLSTLASVVIFSFFSTSALAQQVPIDLTPWTVVQYEFNDQPDAIWVLSNNNQTATQTVNADGSYLRSNFLLTNTAIDGTWRVNTTNDDDFMGFVFGEQDRNHYYLFDWKKADQNDATFGFAQVGMTVKLVSRASGNMIENDLWPTAGSVNVTPLKHNSIPWVSFTDYQFHLEFHPGVFSINIKQGSTTLESWTISDNTYTTGHFGFYNDSQDSVVYSGFTIANLPEPSTFVLGALGLASLAPTIRRRLSRI